MNLTITSELITLKERLLQTNIEVEKDMQVKRRNYLPAMIYTEKKKKIYSSSCSLYFDP